MKLIAPSGRTVELDFDQPASAANDDVRISREQIAPLIDASLDEGTRRALVRERIGRAVEWPGDEPRRRRGERVRNKPIPKSTLYRWLAAYRRDGYLGLLPKRRRDRGKPRHVGTAQWIHYAIALLGQGHSGLAYLLKDRIAQGDELVRAIRELWRMPRFHPVRLMNDNRGVQGVNLGRLWGRRALLRPQLETLLELAATGRIEPVVDGVYSFSDAPQAHGRLQSRQSIGKILLRP